MEPVTDHGAYREFLARRRAWILEAVESACERTGRDPSDVQVFAVSKTVGPDEVVDAMAVGYTCFAENRPQELVRKVEALAGAGEAVPRFDMIGNLQKNKVNAVLGRAEVIQSVSSVHLAEAVSRRAAERSMAAKVLFEVNVSGEPTKSGFTPADLAQWAEHLAGLEGIEPQGLMTMAPAHEPVEDRETFKGLRELRDSLETETGLVLPQLSCGMSDDFEIAVEEGSTIVRLGRVVFDPDYAIAGAAQRAPRD